MDTTLNSMIVNSSLLEVIFRAFHIQRWNDRIRPMELIEMDKHAHKMIIAYCLGHYEQSVGNTFDWSELIKKGIYELLRRIVISDIKSPIFNEIRKHKDIFFRINQYIYNELEKKIESSIIKQELCDFLLEEQDPNSTCNRILNAAHIYASYWEFEIIKQSNPQSYQNIRIEAELLNDINSFSDLKGIKKLLNRNTIYNFVDLCNQLRFQYRWAQTPRVPQTSVLGHCMMVACVSYFFTRDLQYCPQRIYNNFFGGLFHDLPEAVTRDIISPVKDIDPELAKLIKEIEGKLAEKEIFPHLEEDWKDEIRYFTQDEFSNKIIKDGKVVLGLSDGEISSKYNEDKFMPYDGELLKAADDMAAFLEAWYSCSSGIKSDELVSSTYKLKKKYANRVINSIPIHSLFEEFNNIIR